MNTAGMHGWPRNAVAPGTLASRSARPERGRIVAAAGSLVLSLALAVALGPAPAAAGDRKGSSESASDAMALVTETVTWSPGNVAAYGRNQGTSRLTLGQVVDADGTEGSDWLGEVEHHGKRHDILYRLTAPVPRESLVRSAVGALLERTGLLAAPGPAVIATVNVTVRSNRIVTLERALAAEVFLDFTFEREGTTIGRVLAFGNAKSKKKMRRKRTQALFAPVYQAAMDDALWKLVTSKTFRGLVGDGWHAGEPPPASVPVERFDKARYYGPSRAARETLAPLRAALGEALPAQLVIEDFAFGFGMFPLGSSAERAGRVMPDRLRSHLDALYPGAFERIVRTGSGQSEQESGLVVAGRVLRYDADGDEQSLEVEINLRDGRAGTTRFSIHVDSRAPKGADTGDTGSLPTAARWLGHVPVKRDGPWGPYVRDIEEMVVRDLGYLLAMGRPGGYTRPVDIEVRFDDTPYPPLPAP